MSGDGSDVDPGAGGGRVWRVAQLWRFPVKSMQGEQVESAALHPFGLIGDRRFALRDPDTGKVLTAKRVGALLEASARTEADGSVVITLPGGTEVAADDPTVHGLLSDWLGRPCRLDAPGGAGPETPDEFEMSFNVEAPDTDLFTWPCPPGSFVDLASAHLLTTASIAAARARHPEGDWDVRRFRPTALLDGDGPDGFVEDAWVGRTVHLGSAVLTVDMPTIRCPMPTRPQPGGLVRDLGVAATLRDHHDNNLGVYATVTTAGPVAIGDELVVD